MSLLVTFFKSNQFLVLIFQELSLHLIIVMILLGNDTNLEMAHSKEITNGTWQVIQVVLGQVLSVDNGRHLSVKGR